jgi:DNA polymerase-3 subunit alpha
VPAHVLPNVPPWAEAEKLQQEKVALGFYLSGHPYQAYQKEIATFVHTDLGNIKPQEAATIVSWHCDGCTCSYDPTWENGYCDFR